MADVVELEHPEEQPAKKTRRKRYSFSSPQQEVARETLQTKLGLAGMDVPDAAKTLLDQANPLLREAQRIEAEPQVLGPDPETQIGSIVKGAEAEAGEEAKELTDEIVADRPLMFAHRRTKQIDTEQLIKLCVIGCTEQEIAIYFGVAQSTISTRFRSSLQKGRELRRRLLRQRQTEVALAGNPAMLIWLGKQELGQRNNVEVSGPNGGPVTIAFFDAILAEKKRRGL